MLLSDEAESVVFLVLVAGHVGDGEVLIVVKVLVKGKVTVVALSDLKEGRNLDLAESDKEKGLY